MNRFPSFDRMMPTADLTERLGWCLLHFFWQGVAIAFGLALLLRFCRKGTPELRHALCGLALLGMVAAPVMTWALLGREVSPSGSLSIPGIRQTSVTLRPGAVFGKIPDKNRQAMIFPDTGLAGESLDGEAEEAGVPRRAVTAPDLDLAGGLRGLGWFWLTGTGLVAAWRVMGLCGMSWLIRRARAAPEALTRQAAAMAQRCGLRQAPLVRITGRLMSPAVAGVLRPVLLLPAAALAGLSPRELDFILAHEFAHIRRHDFLLGLLRAAVETLFFFHPAVWWVSHRMGLEREHACDDAAIRVTGSRQTGATALARLAELQLQCTLSAAPAAGGRQLLQRVQRLLKPAPAPRSGNPLMLMPVLLLGLLMIPLFLQRAESQDDAVAKPGPAAPTNPTNPTNPASPIPVMRGSITDRNGVILAESVKGTRTRREMTFDSEDRRYPLGSLVSHVIGYTKQDSDIAKRDSGAARLERSAEAVLQSVPVKAGKAQPALILSLDARYQQLCREALRDGGVGRGTAVILDISNGDILAMASVPDFDPNAFVPSIDESSWKNLVDDPTLPLVNRALSAWPPGSTFKLITALAAGESGDWTKQFECTGSVTYGGRPFNCWTVQVAMSDHGLLSLPKAVQRSCNCYFYQLGNAAGPERIARMGNHFGLGDVSFERLGAQQTDFMPDPAWWERQNKGPWTSAKTANISIGQGEVQATPLQMAGVAAAIANGGKIWNPRIISRTLVNGSWQDAPLELRHDLIEGGVPPDTLAALREGMYQSVHTEDGGTGKRAKSSLITIAGKTGTAQNWRMDAGPERPGILNREVKKVIDNHTWFIGFAPFEKPRYAFSVVVANGQAGGAVCAPIAKRIMESIELLNRGELEVELKPALPAKGHFKFLESVSYAQDLK